MLDNLAPNRRVRLSSEWEVLVKPSFVACVSLLLVGCGSSGGGGLSSFANAYAASYCHFIYHCCTPSDRANPENPFAITSTTEQMIGFATEEGCANSLGAQAQVALQPYEDSVAAKRMSYDQTDTQACLSALGAAASACDPNAFWAASLTGGACDVLPFFTGLAPAGGDCTMDGDCAIAASTCAPVDAGMGQEGPPSDVITGAATCVSPQAIGMTCTENNCAAGSCCSYSYTGSTCLAYVAEGAMCVEGCDMTPCDPAADYCDSMGTGVCQPLIASGGTCNPYYGGSDCKDLNCLPSGDDTTGTCNSNSDTLVIKICVGNPNGF
jgi:hypothetical protein